MGNAFVTRDTTTRITIREDGVLVFQMFPVNNKQLLLNKLLLILAQKYNVQSFTATVRRGNVSATMDITIQIKVESNGLLVFRKLLLWFRQPVKHVTNTMNNARPTMGRT